MLTKLRSEFNKQSSISSQPTEDTKILLRSIEASCQRDINGKFEKIYYFDVSVEDTKYI